MPDFDDYIAELRQCLGSRLSADAERELRVHFHEGVAAGMAEGLTREQAEAAAFARLGNVKDVARAFDRERSPLLHRLVGGPVIGLLADVRTSWRLTLLATILTTLLGALAGQVVAPTYVATVPVGLASGHVDYGLALAVDQAVAHLRDKAGIPIASSAEVTGGQWATVEVRAADREAAIAGARREAEQAVRAFPSAFLATSYANGDRSVGLRPLGEPEVRADHPTIPAAALGAMLGLIAAGLGAWRRHSARR